MSIRIVLADDHQMLRSALAGLLDAVPDFEVVAQADNGRVAVELAEEFRPDVVILDITMPVLNGIEATRRIREVCPGVRVLALSMHAENRFVTEALRAGASGYVLKMADFDELAAAVRSVAGGGTHVSPELAGQVIRELADQVPAPDPAYHLSDREREVLQLLADGRSSKESAQLLHVSVKTIDSHRRQVMQKLGLGSVAELTKYAIKSGLTSL